MSLTQYPNDIHTCKMQNEIKRKPNETYRNQTKRNQNRNTVAMSAISCYNENEIWGIS